MVRLDRLWPELDLLVVMAVLYGSECCPKVLSIRSETFRGPFFGRDFLYWGTIGEAFRKLHSGEAFGKPRALGVREA